MKKLICSVLPFLMLLLTLNLRPQQGKADSGGCLTAYYANWNVYQKGQGPDALPWDRLDCINHAFWKIIKNEDGFTIASTDPQADLNGENAVFPQYRKMKQSHPNTKLLLSIGGWTCCGYFSEMALTAESRGQFIQSCLDFLDTYPYFDGIDIDWEYPGVARTGSGSDEGCPVKGNDYVNYTLVLREFRQALDSHFGKGAKQLTVCACGGVEILKKQDYASLFPYVDGINLMTYDLTGHQSPVTGHHSPLWGNDSASAAVDYLLAQGVPASKIRIGSPLYARSWGKALLQKIMVGTNASGKGKTGDIVWNKIKKLESVAVPAGQPGWHMGYDEDAQAAYLWNDDPTSSAYRDFLSYESERSLDAKLRYIKTKGLGGMIVWETAGDEPGEFPMLTRMHNALHP